MQYRVELSLDDEKIRLLDTLAESMEYDRSQLLNEVVDDFLEVQKWQLEEIDRAIASADAGNFATDTEVRAAFDAFRHKC